MRQRKTGNAIKKWANWKKDTKKKIETKGGEGGIGGRGREGTCGDSVYAVSYFFLEETMTGYGYSTKPPSSPNKCVNQRACM